MNILKLLVKRVNRFMDIPPYNSLLVVFVSTYFSHVTYYRRHKCEVTQFTFFFKCLLMLTGNLF